MVDKRSQEPVVEPLTRREREVLGLLAQGLTAPEMAEQLTLAVSSVKWHIQQLYGKLGVNTKRQALSRAQELGLLGTRGAPPASESRSSAARPKHNLPLQVTRLFGRETELAQVGASLAEQRLVTLTGPGGVGKTRLALLAAGAALADYADGVWFVALAPLSDPGLVPQQVAASLGVHEEHGRPLQATLVDFLRQRHVLLVLDNCEHLLEACAALAEALLTSCPRVRLLASSREPLGISGEAVMTVPSLSFPDPSHLPSIERLSDYAAFGLLLDRARLVQPGYAATPANAAALARICQRLDGIPLAIEMAAARLRLLSAEQLADRLDDAFQLLTGGSRTALPRQRTLRATLDWSYQLLSPAERLLFQRLSVFADGWTLEAAEAIGAGSEGEEVGAPDAAGRVRPADILDLLASLVAKSLVIAERRPGEDTRYHLLEVTRQFAQEKLQDSGESERVRRQHRDYYLAYAEANFPKLDLAERLAWAPRLAAEHSNFRQALDWSYHDLADLDAVPRLVSAVYSRLFAAYGWTTLREHLAAYDRALARCREHGRTSGLAYVRLLSAATAPFGQDDPPKSLALAQEAVAASRQLGPAGHLILASTLMTLAYLTTNEFDQPEAALPLIAEADSLIATLATEPGSAQELSQRKATVSWLRAMIAHKQGRYQEASEQARISVQQFQAGDNPWRALRAQIFLGIALASLGDHEAAREQVLEAMRLADEGNDKEQMSTRRSLAFFDLQQGKLDSAKDYCWASLRMAAAYPDPNIVASCLGIAAAIAAQEGQPVRAARLSGAAEAMYARQRRKASEDSSLDTLLPGWHDRPDQAELAAALEAGRRMAFDEVVAYALGETPKGRIDDQT